MDIERMLINIRDHALLAGECHAKGIEVQEAEELGQADKGIREVVEEFELMSDLLSERREE